MRGSLWEELTNASGEKGPTKNRLPRLQKRQKLTKVGNGKKNGCNAREGRSAPWGQGSLEQEGEQ